VQEQQVQRKNREGRPCHFGEGQQQPVVMTLLQEQRTTKQQ
jgi:hypothetical protein